MVKTMVERSETLLLIEDEGLLGEELKRHCEADGWEVVLARTLAEARRVLFDSQLEPLVVLSDMNLPDGNALDLLEEVRGRGGDGEWLFISAYGTPSHAVRGLRLGAQDFLEKPCEPEHLDLAIASAARSARAQRRLRRDLRQHHREYSPEAWIGRSTAAREVRDTLHRLAEAPISALVLEGETGTGKGLAARILHYSGARADGPLIELNCAALPHHLLESELFGHEPGAFTDARARRRGLIEQAHGGTLFLDEIGDMELDLQAKLLTVIEDRKLRRLGGEREIQVDVRVLAASNRDLAEQVRKGKLRGDLYHRLSVFRLRLPALAERKEDLRDLVPTLVADFNVRAKKSVRTIPPEVWARLENYAWPGNVRELRNVVERCVLLADSDVFPARWLHLDALAEPAQQPPAGSGETLVLPLDGSMDLDDMDRFIIETVLRRTKFNVTATARALGTTRETLRYRIRKYELGPAED